MYRIAPNVPVPVWVVSSATTGNGLGGLQSVIQTRTYSYSNPVYDASDRAFLGFGTVTATRPGDPSAPGTQTRTPALARFWKERGMRFLGCNNDTGMLFERASEVVAQMSATA